MLLQLCLAPPGVPQSNLTLRISGLHGEAPSPLLARPFAQGLRGSRHRPRHLQPQRSLSANTGPSQSILSSPARPPQGQPPSIFSLSPNFVLIGVTVGESDCTGSRARPGRGRCARGAGIAARRRIAYCSRQSCGGTST